MDPLSLVMSEMKKDCTIYGASCGLQENSFTQGVSLRKQNRREAAQESGDIPSDGGS
jgi:hypothetical protein